MLQIVQTTPECPNLKLINKLIREQDVRERGGGCAEEIILFHYKKNCGKHQNNPITTGLTGLC